MSVNSSFISHAISSGSAEKWRRRASIHQRQDNAADGGMNSNFTDHLLVLLLLNAVVFVASRVVPFSTSISVAVLAASIGYTLKDSELLLTTKSKNRSFASEILVFILRRMFSTTIFQEALRVGLCRIRSGHDFQPESVEWPSDLVMQRMERPQVESILKSLVLYPKTRDLDPLVCSLGIALAQRNHAFYDDIPIVQPISKDEDFLYPTASVLDVVDVPLGYLCSDCGPKTKIGRLLFKISSKVSIWVMNTIELFEETKDPLFFDSVEEAAVFFHYIIRPYIPRSSRRIAYINEIKDVEGDTCANAFAGVGAWRLKAIHHRAAAAGRSINNNKSANWNKREASSTCIPPEGSVAVIDCCWQACMKVRPGYIAYGAAAFFGKDKELLGIWNEKERHMSLLPGDDEDDEPWRWAQYHWKSSIAYEVFTVGHLLEIHWSASNTLVQGAHDLPLSHPIRRLIKPFTWGSALINFQAMVNLVQRGGAITRTGAVGIDEMASHFNHIMENHVHYGTFESFVEKMGEFPEGFTDEIPFLQDGKDLWDIFERFVEDYMNAFYENRKESEDGFLPRVEDDPDLQKFWEHARTARSEQYPLKLKQLSFDNLRELLTWGFFWSCATHNLVANFFAENAMPTGIAGRIGSAVRTNSPESGFQSPINTWLTQAFVLALTTMDNVPFLIESIRDTADFFGPSSLAAYGRDDEARAAFLGFATNLDELSAEIDARNETRGWLATNCFNPRILLCSASL